MSWKISKVLNKYHFIIFVLALILDQASKFWVMHHMHILPLTVTSWLNITLLWNPGVVFGLTLFDHPMAYVILTSCITGFVVYMLAKTHCPKERSAFVFVLAGAIGNIIDRIRFHAVIDFIDVHAYGFHWPTFNIADAAISCSLIWMAFKFLKKPL